jgi:hypothetical protein
MRLQFLSKISGFVFKNKNEPMPTHSDKLVSSEA